MPLQQHFKVMQLALLFITLLAVSVNAESGTPWSSKSKQYHGFATTLSAVTLPSKILTSRTSVNSTSTNSNSAAATYTAPVGTLSKPKVLLIGNTFEFTYLTGFNFTTTYTGPLLDSVYACTSDGEICKLECGQELVSAQQITALLLIPGMDFTDTYTFITGTGGVNPKHGTAGGACISQYSVQWEWGSMFLGSDLPANFSGQYFYSYAEASPSEYPSLVGTEVYELNEALIDHFYNLTANTTFEEVESSLQTLRSTYQYAPARRPPFLVKCDVVSSQIYWHGNVSGDNVEFYTNVITSGAAKPCNTNQDDQGRVAALVAGAKHNLLDFGRVSMIKAFSNFDRPPPQLSAYQSRYFVGEAATEPGLHNSWNVIKMATADILAHWKGLYKAGIAAPNYIGDAKGSLGGTPPFLRNASTVAGSVQGS